mmetsp:Transcript_47826/g.116388  ORF Transcript_47826/g.116388 Transcript_47826/m.116388 type:complete len:88 (-) Transcript_47826:703-966(-)
MKMFAVLCDVRSYRTVHRSLVSFAAAACIGICGRRKDHPARTNQECKAVPVIKMNESVVQWDGSLSLSLSFDFDQSIVLPIPVYLTG